MSEAPERIWAQKEAFSDDWDAGTFCTVCDGGAEYIRADHVDALLKAEREKALREAAGVCERIRTQKTNGPMPERAGFDYEQSILDLIEKDATDDKRQP